MDLAVTGSTGLIGSTLVPYLTKAGHRIRRLIRTKPESARDIYWNPATGELDKKELEGIDAIIHLAGESIAEGRWTAEKKRRIRDSRVQGTTLVAETVAGLSNPPKILLAASAVGYYGNRGTAILTEKDSPGSGFLAEVCQKWEAATEPAARRGIRVVNLRFSLVLSSCGGALKKMLPPFKMGAGGKIGSGEQYWSWIAIDDVLGVVQHVMANESLQGALNSVSPTALTNKEFTTTLGHVLKRPTPFTIPAIAARIAFGEMADEMLLVSARVEPARLIADGYRFQYPDLEEALYHVLNR